MDIKTAISAAVSVEDSLMINERCPPVAAPAVADPEQSATSECAFQVSSLDVDPLALPELQYHELEPAVGSNPAPAAPCLLSVKQEVCLVPAPQPLPLPLPQQPPEPADADRSVTTRRSRRLANETVPFKKRKRVLSPEPDEEEYLLPDHVQDQVQRTAPEPCGRRLRPKRAAQLAAAVEIDDQGPDDQGPDDRDADWSANCSSKTELHFKLEPVAGDTAVSGVETEPSSALPPRRKRGRPRKSQAPQRCAPPVTEDDVSTAADGDGGPRQPPEQKPEPSPPRRGRKSAVPARRGRPPGRPAAVSPITIASSPAATQDDEDADDPAAPSRPTSPPVTEVSRVSCAGLPVSEPLEMSDALRLLEVPSKREQRPCPFCGSLTGCPPPDSAEEHNHAAVTTVSPRRRLRVIVDGTAPTDDGGRRRQLNLGDEDGGRVGEFSVSLRRGRRRARSTGSPGSQELECRTCGKVMLSMSRLKKHQLVHTDERPFHCDRCPKSFKSVHVLNAHQLTHINYRPFRCDLCHQTFAKKWTLRGHMSTHDRTDGADSLNCATCGCEFQDRSTYDSHIKLHTGERKWECKVCHRGFAKKLKLRKHMVVHSQAMLHKCSLCDREFRWKEKLVKHVMLHTGERPFKCAEPRCTKSFRAHSDLNVHLRNVHKKQPKKLDYPIVKSEPKPNHCELLLMRVNEMDGIPPCDLCTTTFDSKDAYLNHIIPAHRDQEAYVCHPCKRVFDSKTVYDDHQDERHRRGEIMWRCQLCPKIFNKRSLFEGHKTLHATKCQCKICFRFASDERRLQNHIIGHRYTDIDNSSHACTICSRQFKLRFSLKNHMFKMHSIDLPSLRKPPMRKFECSICHARFVRPTPAYNHMVRVHNIQPEPEVQDLFDLTNLSVEHPDTAAAEGMSFPSAADPDDPSMQITALQNNIRIKVQAMAAQGMWDASEADGSTYLGGSATRRRQLARLAAGDAPAAAAAAQAGAAAPAAPQQHRPLQTPPPPAEEEHGKTLLHLSPGKRSQVVRVAGSPLPLPLSQLLPPPDRAGDGQRQQIIVIQQEGEEEIDLSRVLGGTAPSDAQTLTMNADGVLVDDQGNPVSLMVEGGGTATHLLEYLRGTEPAAAGR